MSRTPKDNDFANSNASEYDDLTVISGIGQARQQWLRDVLKVRTFSDLAALSAEEIASRLRAEKKLASATEIEAWLAQARELALSAQAAPLPVSKTEKRDFKTFATFVVVFEESRAEDGTTKQRTNVHHMEADKTQGWDGIEQRELCNWMLTRLGTKAPQQSELAAPPAPVVPPVPPLPAFSDKLQEMLAKVRHLEGEATPPPQHMTAPPMPVAPPMFSDKLQQMLAKVRQLEGRTPDLSAPEKPNGNSVAVAAPSMTAVSMATSPEFDDKLQQILAKVRRLESQIKEAALEQVAAQSQTLPPAEAVTTQAVAAGSVTVNIVQVQAFQPVGSETPVSVSTSGQMMLGFIQGGIPFALQAQFKVAGLNVTQKPTTCTAQFYAHEWSTGNTVHLGSTKPVPVNTEQEHCTADLPVALLPAGMYRLQAVVTVDGVPVIGHYEAPVLQVA